MNTRESTISNDKAGARLNYGVHHTNQAKKRMNIFSFPYASHILLMTYTGINANKQFV